MMQHQQAAELTVQKSVSSVTHCGNKYSMLSPHKPQYSPETVPCLILPMSSSSDVIDLERRAMAGGVSLLVCCGAAKKSQPSADLMFILV